MIRDIGLTVDILKRPSRVGSVDTINAKTAQRCAQLVSASTNAIAWNSNAANENYRLRLDEGDNLHAYLRARLAARKLQVSAGRSPCVGVFGPSQAGKSYLVSALSKAKQGSLMVRFGDESVDFLQKINPGGGRESTGVVTRFSNNEPKLLEPGFPVEIRLLSECDVLKILFNSFYSDFDHTGTINLSPFSDEQIRERIESLRLSANKSILCEQLYPEDILDLKIYLESTFSNLISELKTDFWPAAISLAPYLSIENRAKLFAVVWRDFGVFTDLYISLVKVIESLKGAEVCLAPMSAVVSDGGQIGIVDAQLLADLGKDKAGILEVKPIIAGRLGAATKVSRAELAALTAELRLPISEARWKFLNDLDILDFPGARSRLRISDPARVDSGGKSLAAELYLRGKVAFLFQRYTIDQEMSAVLLCVPWGPQEVTGYAPLIDLWVSETNGDTADKRASVLPALLLVLTKFDMDLQAKAGDNEVTERQRWSDRIKSSLLERFGSMDWVSNWDGKPFRNMFWLRNPEIKDSAYMQYQAATEIGINPDHADRIQRLRNYFIEDSQVKVHFENPAEAWDAAMLPQDGGIARIVAHLDRLSKPEFRATILQEKAAKIAAGLIARLQQYFNEGRDQEVIKKLEIYNIIKRDLAGLIRKNELWRLFDFLNLGLEELRALYFAVASGGWETRPPKNSVAPLNAEKSEQGIDEFLKGMVEGRGQISGAVVTTTSVQIQVHPRALRFAQKAIDAWASKLRDQSHEPRIASALCCTESVLTLLVEELVSAAQRLNLCEKLAQVLNPAESNAGATWENIVDRQVTITRTVLGDFVSHLGMSSIPLKDRPGIPVDKPRRRIFEPSPTFNGDSPPLAEVPIAVSFIYAWDWLVGLERVVTDNAGFSGQDSLSPGLNRELGEIITAIKSA